MKKTKEIANQLDSFFKNSSFSYKKKQCSEIQKKEVIEVLEMILSCLFPGYLGKKINLKNKDCQHFIKRTLKTVQENLKKQLSYYFSLENNFKKINSKLEQNIEIIVQELLERLPQIQQILMTDIEAAYEGDPASQSLLEIVMTYPGIMAIAVHRIAHELFMRKVPIFPRMISEYAHQMTGVDIHPGAKIGKYFFIDHGTGVVIGETTSIGDYVKIYQGVTLGALSFPKDQNGKVIKGVKRHPDIGNSVVIYAGATVLGGKTKIGDASVISGSCWVTQSVPKGTVVTAASNLQTKTKKID